MSSNYFDLYVFLPAGLTLICSFIADKLDNQFLVIFVDLILPLIGGIIAFYIHDNTDCNKLIPPPPPPTPENAPAPPPVPQPIINDLVYKAMINAVIAQGFAMTAMTVCNLIVTILSFVPFLGIAVRIISKIIGIIPLVEYMFAFGFYIVTYIFTNMINREDGIISYCAVNISSDRMTAFWFGLSFVLISMFKNILLGWIGLC